MTNACQMNSLSFGVPLMLVSTSDHSNSAKKVAEIECFLSLTYSRVSNKRGSQHFGRLETSEDPIGRCLDQWGRGEMGREKFC